MNSAALPLAMVGAELKGLKLAVMVLVMVLAMVIVPD